MSSALTGKRRDAPARRRPRAKRMARAERSAQIRDCAVQIFARQRIGHANHSQVAEEAGVSLPTLFYHYPDHASLTKAVLTKVTHFLLDTIGRSAIEEGSGGIEAIERILIRLAGSLDAHRDLVAIWLDWSTARSSETWTDYLAFNDDARKLVEPLVAQAQIDGEADPALDVSAASRVVVGMAHMVAQMNLTARPFSEIETAVHRLTEGYFGSRWQGERKK